MRKIKRIEKLLRGAPPGRQPDGLLERLQADVKLPGEHERRALIRSWFSPSGGSVSRRRVAWAAAVVIACLVPLSYGAAKAVKKMFTINKSSVTYHDEKEDSTWTYSVGAAVSGTNLNSEAEARKAHEEMLQLIREGKAKEVSPGLYKGVLSNGEEFAYATGTSGLLIDPNKEQLQAESDDIHELRKAGKFERTLIKEEIKDGVKIRFYKDCFTLSNGKTVTLTTGEEVKDEK